ncbi:MAG: tRNA (N6-isopentenyl adenosine(37)-C2)-methylthiotransferase MiaB [Planctomycetota bacterium]|nr:MAG: tRNA (N6-isopentenyl adenosine(37)-C2)-methylthiotransferase MiaB [Planctomycetota bacterium]REJ95597.1 MAG: tRNA (N6-isopentenyl adenosine(37)-C2)-methylthiotransferase MiaB [Planctomycetota bacterium]REK22625.1 MAG: tRNA (N6-isopentenyl adenosine(37)-C2)-methylthiotransferase MiaB [Planctomycetota bacterium]REK48808.1 MAG: tRNA (N6-isopentenyl adenosine(37)-C2)-methylthiotransferase MiaB [Planctomycetota bacterium]
MTQKLYIETVGCQMNMLDSELVVAALRRQGYELVDSAKRADTILFNTCSVREHAEEKIYSALGRLKHAKRHNPDKVIGVLGCMAQNHQKIVFQRAPYVDLVVGPGQLHQVPQLIEDVRAGRGPQLEVSLERQAGSRDSVADSFESYDPLRSPEMRPSPYQAFVRIQIGCDKFCTYCIVPKVRGPEQGRRPEEIYAEARQLADEGCREITLLGQTVNSYSYRDDRGTTRLADLLYQLSDIAGLDRLKFVTNYPRDMTDDLLDAVSSLPKVSHYLHVPAQSGSDAILRRMKRGYTVDQYREMMARIREAIPDAAVTSDFIVGFCGETDADFAATVELVEACRFKNSFIFKYSERPGTKGAERLADDVPEEVKRRRNNELLAVQNAICQEDNEARIGVQVEVLVEGVSKSAAKREDDAPQVQLTGRDHWDRIVVFQGGRRLIGRFVPVTIYDANAHTLFGEVVTDHVGPEVYSLSV